MGIKPLYRLESRLLVGLTKDFSELCVLDGLVIEVDLEKKKVVSGPEGGLNKIRSGAYIAIRQKEKKEYCKILERKLRKKALKKIETDLESPTKESIETLVWIPDRLNTHLL